MDIKTPSAPKTSHTIRDSPVKMNSLVCLCFALLCVSGVLSNALDPKQAEELCLKKYQTGAEFDMKNALGDWFPIYYWPPNRGEIMEKCGKSSFKEVSASDIKDCKVALPQGETIYEVDYSSDKFQAKRYLYGAGATQVIVDCQNESQEKVVHRDLGNGKLLAAICPSGSAVLLSRNLVSAAELEPIVESVAVMKGTEGAPDCKLP